MFENSKMVSEKAVY